jgi:hypothetical protein
VKRTLILVAATFLLAAGCGGDDAPEDQPFPPTDPGAGETNGFEPEDEIEVELRERGDSGQSGRAVLSPSEAGGTEVVLIFDTDGTFPARIREGTCEQPPNGAEHELDPVVDGALETEVPVELETLVAGEFALEVLGEDGEASACGEIIRARG